MAKVINIVDGVGTSEIINGDYTVTAEVNGYDNTTINPASVSIVDGTNTYAFTIAADGTLTIHVTEDGTTTGTPVVGATFIRTDATGTEYGSIVTSDSNGDAIFDNVPYDATNAPVIYYKQTASDGEHEFSTDVQNTSMTASTSTVEIINARGANRTINLTDANYSGLPVDSGTITLN